MFWREAEIGATFNLHSSPPPFIHLHGLWSNGQLNNPFRHASSTMASSHPPLEQITTLYRQNISKFLFVSDASLKSQTTTPTTHQQHRNNNSTTSTSWMGDAGRSISLRSAIPPILANTHDLDRKATKNKLSNNTKIDGKKTNTAEDNADVAAIQTTTATTSLLPSSSMNSWSDCICMSCGTLLLPPPSEIDVSNTIMEETAKGASNPLTMTASQPLQLLLLPLNSHISLRPLKRGRTRRRRASRVKAKELHNRTLSLQRRGGGGGGNSNNINSTSLQIRNETIQKEKMQRLASMYNLGDGRAKNCIVIKCTFCGMKKKRKGMEIKKSVVSPPPSSSLKSSRVQRSSGNETVNAKKMTVQLPSDRRGVVHLTRKRVEDVSSQIRDNTDFISLGSTRGSGIGAGDARKRKQGGDDAIISPLLLGGKKKKKKQTETPKKGSDLMDFLSSLND